MVVGLDGSPGSDAALAWAVRHSDVFGSIKPVSTWLLPWWASGVASPGVYSPPPTVELQLQAEAELDQQLASVDSSLLMAPVVVHGRAGKSLVEIGADASLIVVGTRGRGALADTLLGSVSTYVASHAPCPVAIIPEKAPTGHTFQKIVVGIDGSESSNRALDWAIEHAGDDSDIVVIHSWSPITASGFDAPIDLTSQLQETAERLTERVIADAVERHGITSTRLDVRTEMGDARNVLRKAASDADLLVVGAKGHHGVAHLLLGSVTTGLVHQPITPVIVVPVRQEQS